MSDTSSNARKGADDVETPSTKSYGVLKAEGSARVFTAPWRYAFFASRECPSTTMSRGEGVLNRRQADSPVALVAYFISLDQYSSYSFEIQALATTFESHTLLGTPCALPHAQATATIGTIRGIFAAVGQPVFAKVTDTVGRWEAFCASAVFYTLGYVIIAASPTIGAYAVGSCIYQVC